MRASANTTILTLGKKKTFVGVLLEPNACTEHEVGIKELKELFGCDLEAAPGLARRTNTVTTRINFCKKEVPLVKLFEDDESSVLLGNEHYISSLCEQIEGNSLLEAVKNTCSELRAYRLGEKQDISSAWSGKDFGIVATGKNKAYLVELYENFKKNNVVITVGGRRTWFCGQGLVLAIADRLPKEVVHKIEERDRFNDALNEYHEKLGIEERLRATHDPENWKVGCRYFCLAPKWKSELDFEFDTDYDVVYYLNPHNQQDCYWGWVTVEDLEDWIKGKGKIPTNGKEDTQRKGVKMDKASKKAHKKFDNNKAACHAWMVDRLTKDGCPEDEAKKYAYGDFVETYYEGDWDQFVEDAIMSAEYLKVSSK